MGLGLGNTLTKYPAKYATLPHITISDCVLAFYADIESSTTLVPTALQFWLDQAGVAANPVAASAGGTAGGPAGLRPAVTGSGVDRAVVFDGGSDRLDIISNNAAYETILDTSDGGWTVVIIATSDDWDGGQQAYVGDRDTSNHFIRHASSANQFRVKVAAENNDIDLDTPSSLTDGQYYCIQVDCTADGNTITLYIDGVAQSDTESLANNTKDLTIESIGHRANTDLVDGGIKSIVVFDRILTSDERGIINDWAAPYIG